MRTKNDHIQNSFPLIAVFSVIAFIGTICCIEILEDLGMLHPFLAKSNIYKYLLALCVFAFAFFALYALFYYFPGNTSKKSLLDRSLSETAYRRSFLILILTVSLLLLHRRFVSELDDFGITVNETTLHQIRMRYALPLVFITGLLAVLLSGAHKDVSGIFVYAGYFAVVVISFISVLVLDIFKADLHHGAAYIESIYNVYHGVPYTLETTGIYGHYALFYAPLLHLFGSDNTTLMLLIDATICATVILSIYCVHNIIEENWLRILAAFACCMCVTTIRSQNYWQVQPHRTLFALVTAAYVIHLTKRNHWRFKDLLIGYLLSLLAILWNTESGLFCAVAIAACFLVHDWQTEKWYSAKMLKRYILHIAFIVGSVFAAVGIMNIYNFLCGHRELELSVFFFPMGVSGYMNGTLKYDISVQNGAWIYSLVLFSLLLLISLYYSTFFFQKKELSKKYASRYAPLLAAVAILGLLNFSYYANRAAYKCLEIIFQLACIGMCLLWRIFSGMWKDKQCRKHTVRQLTGAVISVSCILVISVLAMQSIVFAGTTIKRKYEAGHYIADGLQAACQELQANIPKDTFAFGNGITLMYEELGWDTIGRYRDISDILIDGNVVVNKIASDAVTHDSFVVYLITEREQKVLDRIMELDPRYELTKEIELNWYPLKYYVRTPWPAVQRLEKKHTDQ